MSKVHPFFFAIIAFLLSYFFIPYYYLGDQSHYRIFYNEIGYYGLEDGYKAYRDLLGASEPVYFIIVYLFNDLIEKDLLISIFNSLLGFFLCKVLVSLNINKFVLYSFILNFYFIVLMFAAERLKFGVLFLLISLLYSSNIKKNAFLLLSFLAHLQMLLVIFIQYVSSYLINFYNKKGNIIKKVIYTGLGLGILLTLLYIMRSAIETKIIANSHKAGIDNIFKPLIFCLLSIYYSKSDSFRIIVVFLPLIFVSSVVGEERIVIFCYAIFCYYALKVKKGVNLGLIASNSYFIYKGIEFIYYIIENGNGFDNS